MNFVLTKRQKGFLYAILALVFAVVIVPATLISYYLQPSVITPLINKTASKYIKTDLQFGRVDLKIFGSYPNVQIQLLDGYINSLESLKDSTIFPTNKLISFESLNVEIDAYDVLFNRQISVKSVNFHSPDIYMAIDTEGNPNWMITNSIDSQQSDTTSLALNIDRLSIDSATMVFDDRLNDLYTRTLDYSVELSGNFNPANSAIKADMAALKSLVWRDGALVAKGVNMLVNVDIIGDSTTNSITLRNGVVNLDNLRMDMSGYLGVDTLDFNLEARSNGLNNIIAKMPNSLIDSTHQYSTTGMLEMRANLSGKFHGNNKPKLSGELSLVDGSLRYDDFPQGIDELAFKAHFDIDPNNLAAAYIALDNLTIRAGDNYLKSKGRISKLLSDPLFEMSNSIDIDFTQLSRYLPFSDSVVLSGSMSFDGDVNVSASQITGGDYARAQVAADIALEALNIEMPFDSLYLEVGSATGKMSNDRAGLLSSSMKLTDSKIVNSTLVKAEVDTLFVEMQGKAYTDSTSSVIGNFLAKGLVAMVDNDTLNLKSPHLKVGTYISKSKQTFDISTNLLAVKYYGDSLVLKKANIDMTYADSLLNGVVGFNRLTAYVVGMRRPMVLSKAKLRWVDSDIFMDNLSMKIGRSKMILTGRASNVIAAVKGEGDLVIESNLKSEFLNMGQLSRMYDPALTSIDSTYSDDDEALSDDQLEASTGVFEVPKGVNLLFKMDVDRTKYHDIEMTDVVGNLLINQNKVRLEGVALNTLGAKIRTSLEYGVASDTTALSRFVFVADSIDVARAIELLPSIDTILPMMKSLSGALSLNISASALFDSTMTAILPSVSSAVMIKGRGMTLNDGKMLEEVADMLKFKKSKSTVIDSLKAEILIDNGIATVLPFRLDINRYSLAIGGTHTFDQNIDYHISVLKSQIPFKMGINVTGTFDDMDIDIGKTKYKELDEIKNPSLSYPQYLERWNKLSRGLKLSPR